ncbi:hypothetical protein C8F04DRAFT_1179696 [Mycena alexandri]|uniref:Uncharacterized protein n=1 Tax=Mycena alexandri TaxID=1745969 RepID=A0AAD6T311_9AGAR|nr:hypothetical protein C8F04DRAFT_1179696 [Mycena alexandri]
MFTWVSDSRALAKDSPHSGRFVINRKNTNGSFAPVRRTSTLRPHLSAKVQTATYPEPKRRPAPKLKNKPRIGGTPLPSAYPGGCTWILPRRPLEPIHCGAAPVNVAEPRPYHQNTTEGVEERRDESPLPNPADGVTSGLFTLRRRAKEPEACSTAFLLAKAQ